MVDSAGSLLANDIKNAATVCELVRNKIKTAGLWGVPGQGCDDCRTHLVSPEPFVLDKNMVELINELGSALLAFYQAVNDLYLRSGNDWVNEYLDIGKSDDLIRHAGMNYQKRALPLVIRPDILISEDKITASIRITELDSVPGGMGQLDCLSAAYEEAGFDLIGSPRGMRDGFAAMLREAAGKDDPVCAIIVSDESIDYLPEMTYLGSELQKTGLRAFTVRPKEVIFTEEGLYIDADGERLRIDVVYRFFELFDLLNIPKSELISYAARKKLVVVTPPYKPFLEEKMLLALLHNESLKDYWKSTLSDRYYDLLKSTLVPTYILDNRPVPPHAQISEFRWQGKPIRDWRAIKEGTQKERRLVIKPSGFSPLAWGARGVKVGHDMAQEDWADSIETALSSFNISPYVLQPFSDTALSRVKYCGESVGESAGEVKEMRARVRLCPYYFVIGGEAKLGGVLATACPRDKKLIHGMVDAVMSPCSLQEES